MSSSTAPVAPAPTFEFYDVSRLAITHHDANGCNVVPPAHPILKSMLGEKRRIGINQVLTDNAIAQAVAQERRMIAQGRRPAVYLNDQVPIRIYDEEFVNVGTWRVTVRQPTPQELNAFRAACKEPFMASPPIAPPGGIIHVTFSRAIGENVVSFDTATHTFVCYADFNKVQ